MRNLQRGAEKSSPTLRESLSRPVENAKRVGANAIIGVDFETSDILQGTATVFAAYGTAVIAKPK